MAMTTAIARENKRRGTEEAGGGEGEGEGGSRDDDEKMTTNERCGHAG